MSDRIYMDNAATTAVRPEVLARMLPLFGENYGNASSVHATGREARRVLENARRQCAQALNAKENEIYFTSCGTESDNWALTGAAFALKEKGDHIITSKIEHPAVLRSCEWLEKQGFHVTYIGVDQNGLVDPDEIEKAITDRTILISIMTANNEIGTIQPVSRIGAIARERGILFHTDAVQAAGAIPIDPTGWGADLISLSGHKFNGPKGTGLIYIRSGTHIERFMRGGEQERGMRAATENVPGIAGMAEALQLSVNEMEETSLRIMMMRDRMIRELTRIPGSRLNGHSMQRLPGNIHLSFEGIEGEALLLRLDLYGIAASSGSACTSGSVEASHVLKAIGLSDEMARGSIRLSLGKMNTEEEADEVIRVLPKIVEDLRRMTRG